ncbi:hypothetical protein ACFUTV_39900 [Streptomyces sp. NPDC057298]|uniref:hypothetical protein n=1 Tax=Streptomyces sp. NPDC057298 TaxID=3346091 RepID=UPI003625E55C
MAGAVGLVLGLASAPLGAAPSSGLALLMTLAAMVHLAARGLGMTIRISNAMARQLPT